MPLQIEMLITSFHLSKKICEYKYIYYDYISAIIRINFWLCCMGSLVLRSRFVSTSRVTRVARSKRTALQQRHRNVDLSVHCKACIYTSSRSVGSACLQEETVRLWKDIQWHAVTKEIDIKRRHGANPSLFSVQLGLNGTKLYQDAWLANVHLAKCQLDTDWYKR